MNILLSGGGTGGHITPLLAVAHELKKLEPSCRVIFVGERNGKHEHFTEGNTDIDQYASIFAGKFRRYHGESWIKRVLDFKTIILNIRDAIMFIVGTLECLVTIKRLNPDIILLKGGFVGVPVGLAAAFWQIPYITHDSDTLPGLANRIVGRWAKLHATAMPAEYYSYNPENIRHVGVLVGSMYHLVSGKDKLIYKQAQKIEKWGRVLLVTGGSGGAGNINKAMRSIVSKLLETYQDLYVIHQVGVGKGNEYEGFSHERLKVLELLKPMHEYSGAADLIVTRAGANTLAEFGIQGKACIVVPNPMLTGGHQIKNGQYLSQNHAALVLDEKQINQNAELLLDAIVSLLNDESARQSLANKLNSLTITDAATRLAEILLNSVANPDEA
jgi:UDP-N-acetylglucosamine--N-acetylmuramyl-(pentapeptide) pyrophosphoryl-undecaprenol N-acetylglucosamine transferase